MTSSVSLSPVAVARILLATDFSFESENAFYCAVSLAERLGAKLYLSHILPAEATIAGGEPLPALSDAMRNSAEKSMSQLLGAQELEQVPHEVILRSGPTCSALVDIVSDKNIELVVMGTRGHGGFAKLFLGSTAEQVIRHATCPVLTVGPHVEFTAFNRLRHILFATDFSSGSLHALIYAVSLAHQDNADLTLLHVIETASLSDSELMDWKQQDQRRMTGILPEQIVAKLQIEIEVRNGIPDVEILQAADARKTNLIVMGSHRAGAVATHLPWTVLHQVLQSAHCAVLTVRGD